MALLLSGIALVTFTLTRVAIAFYTGTHHLPLALWPLSFMRGAAFDLATIAYLCAPLFLYQALVPKRVRASAYYSAWAWFGTTVLIFFLLFAAVAEFVFWMEFESRFNFIALDYLIYTNEVFKNIWQSYPVVWIVLGLGTISSLVAWQLTAYRPRFLDRLLRPPRPATCFTLAFLLPALSLAFFAPTEKTWKENAYADQVSSNGWWTLASAARQNDLDYDRWYATMPADEALKTLKRLGVEWTDNVERRTHDWWGDDAHDELPPFLSRRPKNVVLISVESLSADFVGAYGSTQNITPQLDQLARQSLLFRNVFATGTRTVRGLEALALATPPIPGQAIVRRPKNAHLASVGEMLRYQGYQPLFLYGGYGYFDNMNAFFRANNYVVIDRTNFASSSIPFENAWGVADESLFDNTLLALDHSADQKKSFFAHVMTTSNHRPYTYPDGRIDIPSPGGRQGAVKYSDYAIGRFIEKSRSHPWFKDTLFVITADHCASVAGRTELPVGRYRIPLLFYGPGMVKTGVVDRMVSQIDIAPTILDALGAAGDDNLFGKEIHEQPGPARAFISNYQSLGYLKNNQLVVLKPKRQIEGYCVDPKTWESRSCPANPELVKEAIAYYQTSSRAYKHGDLQLLWKETSIQGRNQ